jgi:broad specificity phosphatase PhoE
VQQRKLILVKHARPDVQEQVPSREWRLSVEGREACAALADVISRFDPAVIVVSDEPKARETGELVAKKLDKPVEISTGLHEHDRGNVPMMRSREFISTMAMFFKQPARLVLGRESANQAAARFKAAVDGVVAAHPQGNLALVTHGTVLALFAAGHGAGDGFLLWRSLGLPSLMVFSIPDFELLEAVERIAPRA